MHTLSEKDIYTLLREQNYVPEEDIDAAWNTYPHEEGSFGEYVIDKGLLTYDLLGQAIAEKFGVPYIDFGAHINMGTGNIPSDLAIKHRVVFFEQNEKEVVVATDDPTQKKLKTILRAALKKRVTIGYAMPEDIERALFQYRPPLSEVLQQIYQNDPEDAPAIVDALFEEAVMQRASDIHFEPRGNAVAVRFRVDGMLTLVASLPYELYEVVTNRIKVAAQLRIDQHQSPQDGALRAVVAENDVDMRVSITPLTDGEKIVIRLLGEYVSNLSFADIGMHEEDQELFLRAARKPFGMILVTGPTGSGKTTTLYSLVKLLNKPTINISTIEDPVEYKISGVNQMQVNKETDLTFANGLRSIVRQDPDVILIGEIRDKETAEIAVNAALTGHLVLSTFHANDAATAIPRLLDMGIEPFLLASTLELVVGQRLVRTLREDARVSKTYTPKQLKDSYPDITPFVPKKKLSLYEVSDEANGYLGRTALFEMLPISREIEAHILKSPSAQQIWNIAQKNGARSLFEDGVRKLLIGKTSPDELLRVVEAPQQYDES